MVVYCRASQLNFDIVMTFYFTENGINHYTVILSIYFHHRLRFVFMVYLWNIGILDNAVTNEKQMRLLSDTKEKLHSILCSKYNYERIKILIRAL